MFGVRSCSKNFQKIAQKFFIKSKEVGDKDNYLLRQHAAPGEDFSRSVNEFCLVFVTNFKNLRNSDHENGIFRTENQLSEIIIVTYPSEVRQDTSTTNDISFGTHKLIKLLPLTVQAVFPEKYSFNFYKN